MKSMISFVANLQTTFINFMRIAIFIVMAWIGGLKAFQYEADGIIPFVTNSPFMNFFLNNHQQTLLNDQGVEVPAYTLHKNPEGKVVQKNIDWHRENGTYAFSYGLGSVILIIGILVL